MKKYFILLPLVILHIDICTQGAGREWSNKPNITRFVFVVPSYNNKEWYKRNLESIFKQTYDNYRVIYIDDYSPDGTGELVEKYIAAIGRQDQVTLIRNEKRIKAMANIYKAIQLCDDNEVIVMLDGDDWLYSLDVLKELNTVYKNKECLAYIW